MISLERQARVTHLAAVDTALGRFALAASDGGLCWLVPTGDDAGPETPGGVASPFIAEARAALLRYAAGDPRPYRGALDPHGSEFQRRVWRRLLDIPFGGRVTYGEIAADLGIPHEARAVGAAVAANPVAILVPCHRVIGADGSLRGYAWGLDLKRRLLEHEAAASGSAAQLALALNGESPVRPGRRLEHAVIAK